MLLLSHNSHKEIFYSITVFNPDLSEMHEPGKWSRIGADAEVV